MEELMTLVLTNKDAREPQAIEQVAMLEQEFTPWLPD